MKRIHGWLFFVLGTATACAQGGQSGDDGTYTPPGFDDDIAPGDDDYASADDDGSDGFDDDSFPEPEPFADDDGSDDVDVDDDIAPDDDGSEPTPEPDVAGDDDSGEPEPSPEAEPTPDDSGVPEPNADDDVSADDAGDDGRTVPFTDAGAPADAGRAERDAGAEPEVTPSLDAAPADAGGI